MKRLDHVKFRVLVYTHLFIYQIFVEFKHNRILKLDFSYVRVLIHNNAMFQSWMLDYLYNTFKSQRCLH